MLNKKFRALLFAGLMFMMVVATLSCEEQAKPTKSTKTTKAKKKRKPPKDPNKVFELKDDKIIIYQMMTRLFGNKNTNNIKYGTCKQNGVGKFKDITTKALQELKKLGITHVWYTGVLEHAIMADFTKYGIPLDDADVIKGRAGSPYAIKDYYDVNPDLAVNVKNRMKEFQSLISRTHKNGLKVIIDFVPNHVARKYISDAKPKGVKDLGASDDKTKAFDPNNNYYYLPGKSLEVPKYNPLGKNETFPTEDGKFDETPAKVTGNDQFINNPGVGTWFETVKLNYGVDIQNGRKRHFDPVPNTWHKMVAILKYWAKKDVDGFRCDMAEMVPVEFWEWAIPQVKKVKPSILFIAEIYNPNEYKNYIKRGKFDYLYDKVGLYDSVKGLIKPKNKGARVKGIYYSWRKVRDFAGNMLSFLENHDEQRLAHKYFAKDPFNAIPGMVVSATIFNGPVMIYFGQEVGEPGKGAEGFGGKDARTTIFDYWGVPEHQKWMNGGKFDGGGLSAEQKKLRATYQKLFKLVRANEAIREGNYYDLNFCNGKKQTENFNDSKVYTFIRYTKNQAMLILVNFQRDKKDPEKPYNGKTFIKVPAKAWENMGLEPSGKYVLKDVFGSDTTIEFEAADVTNRADVKVGVPIDIKPYTSYIFELKKAE